MQVRLSPSVQLYLRNEILLLLSKVKKVKGLNIVDNFSKLDYNVKAVLNFTKQQNGVMYLLR